MLLVMKIVKPYPECDHCVRVTLTRNDDSDIKLSSAKAPDFHEYPINEESLSAFIHRDDCSKLITMVRGYVAGDKSLALLNSRSQATLGYVARVLISCEMVDVIDNCGDC